MVEDVGLDVSGVSFLGVEDVDEEVLEETVELTSEDVVEEVSPESVSTSVCGSESVSSLSVVSL